MGYSTLYSLVLIVFVGAALFFAGYHNVDLIFNGCILMQYDGYDCKTIEDRNSFLVWGFPQGYINGVTMMMISFFATIAFSISIMTKKIESLEKELEKRDDVPKMPREQP